MRSVLCYGDSNTYGQADADTPDTRFEASDRWPGVVRQLLEPGWLVIEEGLSGRTTVDDDPVEGAERNGRRYLRPCILSHKPLDLVILMLGTNDLKRRFNKSPSEIGMGVRALVWDIRALPAGHGGRMPEVLLVAPPPIQAELGDWAEVFEGGHEKSLALAEIYERVAEVEEVHFFDAGQVVDTAGGDGFHISRAAHRTLGEAMAHEIEAIGWP
ncbi:SGNH/GDSL hydrolase family protein [Psychromarinibacter sp. C21-152]|uniref:SGNH/GDSL hydrolase family protein n=1 Tax=Psychromarinibacter sediminicola TaxID=3033385 RepID=A0AAE3NXF4_9RHOB|nr:SGNH/GDSL hydrolase family protein [Psychromarinibacter sediminicola]MDF0603751.1 SGNH/GDSL hydrolase family protein [Psychromarinibacter sediminicola]